eukprot:7680638-Pyramimonas_sp.AAC.1
MPIEPAQLDALLCYQERSVPPNLKPRRYYPASPNSAGARASDRPCAAQVFTTGADMMSHCGARAVLEVRALPTHMSGRVATLVRP